MADHWQDSGVSTAVVRDDDEAPDNWEEELEEKPEPTEVVEEKPKVPTKAPPTTKNKASKKKYNDEDDSSKTAQQSEKTNQISETVDKTGPRQSLDNLNLLTRDEFLDYSLRLSNHLENVSKSEFYPEFMENFLNGITNPLSLDAVKRLSTTLQTILIRKQSDEREKKSKAKSKKPAKPQLKAVKQSDFGAFGGDDDYDQDDDYDDDFM